MGNQGVKLDPTIRGAGAKGLENFLKNKVVGQDEAIEIRYKCQSFYYQQRKNFGLALVIIAKSLIYLSLSLF